MNVSLTPELDEFVHTKVESGMYHSASEVVREGLRILKERDEVRAKALSELRQAIESGKDRIERGEYTEHDASSLDHLLGEIREIAANRLEPQKRRGAA